MTGWHCISSPVTFNLKASSLVVKYIVLFLIIWWCFGCVLQSSNRKSISYCLLTQTKRYLLNCFGNVWSHLEAVDLIETLLTHRFLSHDLIEVSQYWSVVKNIFEEGLLVIQVSIKSGSQSSISKQLRSCWMIHIPLKTLAYFFGTESIKLIFSSRAFCNFDSTDLKMFPSGVARDHATGPREYWSSSLILMRRFSLITNNLANRVQSAMMTTSFPLTETFWMLRTAVNVLGLFFFIAS